MSPLACGLIAAFLGLAWAWRCSSGRPWDRPTWPRRLAVLAGVLGIALLGIGAALGVLGPGLVLFALVLGLGLGGLLVFGVFGCSFFSAPLASPVSLAFGSPPSFLPASLLSPCLPSLPLLGILGLALRALGSLVVLGAGLPSLLSPALPSFFSPSLASGLPGLVSLPLGSPLASPDFLSSLPLGRYPWLRPGSSCRRPWPRWPSCRPCLPWACSSCPWLRRRDCSCCSLGSAFLPEI